jgi:hypothetical protein
MIPIVEVNSELILGNMDKVSDILIDRILDHWTNKDYFHEESLCISGITGIGVFEEGKDAEVLVNYDITCKNSNGLHRFIYYTTESSLERSITERLQNLPDSYNPQLDHSENPMSNATYHKISQDEDGNDDEERTFEEPVYYPDVNAQPIDVIEDWNLNYALGTALESILLYNLTGEINELNKAVWYILREISRVEITREEGLGN